MGYRDDPYELEYEQTRRLQAVRHYRMVQEHKQVERLVRWRSFKKNLLGVFKFLLILVVLAVGYIHFSNKEWKAEVYKNGQPVVNYLHKQGFKFPWLDSLLNSLVAQPGTCPVGVVCPATAPDESVSAVTPLPQPAVTPPAVPVSPVAPTPPAATSTKKHPAHKKPPAKKRSKHNVGTAPSAAKVSGDSIIATAARWIGADYAWGGGNSLGPSHGVDYGAKRFGFDCSGLTSYVLFQVGIYPKGKRTNAWMQFTDPKALPVPANNLRAGDLVFFGRVLKWSNLNGRRVAVAWYVHHVGIYNGAGQVISAPYTGAKVGLTPLSHWKDYLGARRYTPPGLRPRTA